MVHSHVRHNGSHLRLVIDEPKGNIISSAVIRQLRRALGGVADLPAVALVTIEGAGNHFSYGASVTEHRPGLISELLPEFHTLIAELMDAPAPTAAIVRGQCLGGGFEIALACDLVFAAADARLGVPEIALGVFPPAASALLPLRVGASRAASAILCGNPRPAEYWVQAGLLELIAPPEQLETVVDRWIETHLADRSAAALRYAALASRFTIRKQVELVLPHLERLYLETLMATHDAGEGIDAFLEKRQPVWRHA